jgi:hypothetical protein
MLARTRRRTPPSPTAQALRIALGLFLLSGAVAGTSASFNASTSNSGTFATDALVAPSSFTGTATGNDVALAWTSGSMASGESTFGHRVTRWSATQLGSTDGQTPPTCTTSDTFGTAVTTTTNAGLSYTDTSAASSANGSYRCYRIETQYPQVSALWFSQTGNKVALVQLGFVAQSLQAIDGPDTGTNKVSTGDSFVFRFSQSVDTATGPTVSNGICLNRQGSSALTINFGRTATVTTNCGGSETNIVGKITGVTSSTSTSPSYAASWVWTDCVALGQCKTLTATVGAIANGAADMSISGGTPIFVPSATMKTPVAAGALALCTSANAGAVFCQPTPFGTV